MTDPPRDRYGRYLLPIPGTDQRKAHTRVTTITKCVADTYHLDKYQRRMVAHGIGKRSDLYALAAATDKSDKRTLDDLCDKAQEAAGASSGASMGTALHSFTEQLDRGIDVKPPAPWDADLAVYSKTLEDFGINMNPWWIERVLYHPDLLIAGTADRLIYPWRENLAMIADLKTGGFLSWQEISIQLALYARAPYWYDPETDKHGEVDEEVNQKEAMVIHLPIGKAECTLWIVDIEAGWEAAQLAIDVYNWRKRKDLARELRNDWKAP